MTDQISQQRRTKPKSTTPSDLARIETVGNPWWTSAPAVALQCAHIALMPLKMLETIANLAVSLSFVAVFGSIALWYLGYIPDQVVADALADVGSRILGIVESTGLLK